MLKLTVSMRQVSEGPLSYSAAACHCLDSSILWNMEVTVEPVQLHTVNGRKGERSCLPERPALELAKV